MLALWAVPGTEAQGGGGGSRVSADGGVRDGGGGDGSGGQVAQERQGPHRTRSDAYGMAAEKLLVLCAVV